MDAKGAAIFGLDRSYHLDHSLAEAGIAPDDIDVVVASHLHFDHVGGFTKRTADGRLVPRFPKARYVAHGGEWNDATHPHERNRASYLAENFMPLHDAGVLTLVDDGATIAPGVTFRRSGGHTAHHQVVMIESGGRTAVFAADNPTSTHVPDPWIMDATCIQWTRCFQARLRARGDRRGALCVFEHDPPWPQACSPGRRQAPRRASSGSPE
jgi:glyoxylase-like metal-dependent hydrolase (beta-lactamase superfamily II)